MFYYYKSRRIQLSSTQSRTYRERFTGYFRRLKHVHEKQPKWLKNNDFRVKKNTDYEMYREQYLV